MTRAAKFSILSLVLVVSVVLDQITKEIARRYLEGEPTQSFLGDLFRLTFIENHGAFLGMGGSLPPIWRTVIFTGFVSVMLIGFLVWVWRTPNLSRLTLVACGLVVGGGVGNLIDRVLNNGGVVDFLNLGVGTCTFCRTGIFNVADVWIVVGAVLLFFSGDLNKSDETAEAEPESPTSEQP